MLKAAGRIVVVGTLASVAFALSVVPAAAQATAQISGAVTDASGGVLPGVTLTATQTDTGITRTTVTNETGVYTGAISTNILESHAGVPVIQGQERLRESD